MYEQVPAEIEGEAADVARAMNALLPKVPWVVVWVPDLSQTPAVVSNLVQTGNVPVVLEVAIEHIRQGARFHER